MGQATCNANNRRVDVCSPVFKRNRICGLCAEDAHRPVAVSAATVAAAIEPQQPEEQQEPVRTLAQIGKFQFNKALAHQSHLVYLYHVPLLC